MPYLNRIKDFQEKEYYHVYARGINRINIYNDDADYKFYLYLLKQYLSKDFKLKKIINNIPIEVSVNTSYGKTELYTYCLMKNHFHLILKNIESTGISGLMKKILSVYVGYYNKKYTREGPLIQGNYRAVHIKSDAQLIHTSRYIHTNPHKDGLVKLIKNYPYISYQNYLYNKGTTWLKVNNTILESTDYENIESYSNKIEKNIKLGFL